jgi:cytochrome c oxidase assembly factor CtaG
MQVVKSYAPALYWLLVLLILAALPVHLKVSTLAIFALAGIWVLEGDLARKWMILKKQYFAQACLAMMLLMGLGFFLASDHKEAWHMIERKGALLAIPPVICSLSIIQERFLRNIFRAFRCCLTLTILYYASLSS